MSAYRDLAALARQAARGTLAADPDPRWAVRLDPDKSRTAAVLMLFGALDPVPAVSAKPLAPAELDVLLIERAATLGNHPGQIAFPGGTVDARDGSVVAAALREAVEETGLEADGVEVLGTLPALPLAVSNFMVTPVLAWWASPSPVAVVDYAESAQVFRVPVRDLLDPDNRYTATHRRGRQTYRGPAFRVNQVVVWGFTAAILDRIFTELGWAVPWDAQREIAAPV